MNDNKYLKTSLLSLASLLVMTLGWAVLNSYNTEKSFSSLVETNDKAIKTYLEKRKPAAEGSGLIETDEEMFKVELFEDWLSVTLQKKLVKENSKLKSIAVHLNPATGKMQISGSVALPEDLLSKGAASSASKTIEHDFSVEFVPVVRHTEQDSMLSIKFSSFKLNGQEFVQTIPVVMNVLGIVLSDGDLFDMFEDKNPGETPSKDPRLRAKEFFEMKNVIFSTISEQPSITLKLRLASFFDLEALGLGDGYEHSLNDLRLWYFGPLKMKNRKANVFYMAAGYGLPSGWNSEAAVGWVGDLKNRLAADSKVIFESQKDAVRECGNKEALLADLKNFYDSNFKNMNLAALELRNQTSVKELFSKLTGEINTILDPNDPDFASEPCLERDELKKYAETEIVSLLSDIKKDQRIQAEIRKTTETSFQDDRPFLIKRLGGDALASLANSLKAVNLDGNPLFAEARFYLLPQLPGLGLYGRLLLDPKTYLPKELTGKASEFMALYKDGIPFEIAVGFLFQPDGWVRLTPKSMTLFKGTAQAVTLQSSDKNGQLVFRIVESSVNTLMQNYRSKPNVKFDLKSLVKTDRGSILFYLDPEILTSDILKLHTSFRIWNAEMIYDETQDQTYLELALGKGPRTQAYTDQLFTREEYNDSQRYDPSRARKDISAPDLRAVLSMPEFTELANAILAEGMERQNAAIEAMQQKDEVKTITRINDISLSSAGKDGTLKLGVTISRVMRKKYKGIDPRGWFKEDKWYNKESTLSVSAELRLTPDSVDRLASKVSLKDPELYARHPALRVDVLSASIITGHSRLLNFFLSNVDLDGLSLGGLLKSFVVKLLPHFQDTLSKAGLDRYFKLAGYKDEFVIIINPRLITPALEVNLFKDGVSVSSQTNRFGMDLSVNLTMSEFSKASLAKTAQKAKEYVSTFVDNQNLGAEALVKLDSQMNESLKAYLEILKDYPRVAGVLKQNSRLTKHWNLTECGFELMAFAWTASQLRTEIQRLITNAKARGLSPNDYASLSAKERQLSEAFIKPLISFYSSFYAQKNAKIVSLGSTAWNSQFLKDATLANQYYNDLGKLK